MLHLSALLQRILKLGTNSEKHGLDLFCTINIQNTILMRSAASEVMLTNIKWVELSESSQRRRLHCPPCAHQQVRSETPSTSPLRLSKNYAAYLLFLRAHLTSASLIIFWHFPPPHFKSLFIVPDD